MNPGTLPGNNIKKSGRVVGIYVAVLQVAYAYLELIGLMVGTWTILNWYFVSNFGLSRVK
jgi:hypothetical protein